MTSPGGDDGATCVTVANQSGVAATVGRGVLGALKGGRRPARVARTRADAARGTATIVALLVAWQLYTDVAHPNKLFLVSPWDVLRATGTDFGNGVLTNALSISLKQFAVGFAFAVLVSVPLGLIIGMARRARGYVEPWVTILYATPLIALAPVFVMSTGLGLETHAIIIGLASCFPIILNTSDSVRTVQHDLREVGIAFKASPLETFFGIALPGAAPGIFTGVRLGMGRGLIGIVVADLFGASGGIGYMIYSASESLNTVQIFVGVFVLGVIGLILSVGLRMLQRRLIPWERDVR